MNRQQAIQTAKVLRKGMTTFQSKDGVDDLKVHDSISAAKRYSRSCGRGVALTKDERFPLNTVVAA